MKQLFLYLFIAFPIFLWAQNSTDEQILREVEHHYAENDGVRIHYVSIGQGPTVVMLHGFPDYWYTWRKQMTALKDKFRVIAVDLRGYNKSEQPEGVENYKMNHLVADVVSVIKAQEDREVVLVGHDWGGVIAWQVAIQHPELIEKLIVCNMTHPTGYSMASLEVLKESNNTSYMDTFRKYTSETLSPQWLAGWVKDAEAKKHYEAAFERSSVDGMVSYYRANMPTKEQRAAWMENPVFPKFPKMEMPVLAIFGTKDQYVPKEGLNNTWDWMSKDFTLVTIPSADHFVQRDAADLVSKSMRMWLLRDSQEIENNNQLVDFSWLLGKWKREKGTSTVYEKWTQAENSILKGSSWVISKENGEIKVMEDIVLSKMGGELFYTPKTAENEFPIPFKLIEQKENRFTFANRKHDFPQQIVYHLTDEGRLEVTIGDITWEKTVKFVFERVE